MTLFRIPQDAAGRVRPLFEPLAFNVEILSILDGNTRGEIWADHPVKPAAAAIWDQILTLYVTGTLESQAFNQSLAAWVESTVAPTAQNFGDSYFNLYCPSPEWHTPLSNIFGRYRVEPGTRCLHTFLGPLVACRPLPRDFNVHRIDETLLASRDLEGLDWLKAWVTSFWHTEEDFLEKGIGAVALHLENKVVSLCISLFVSGRQVEFGTATSPEFQNRGLSTNLAYACVQECLERGLEPIWQCWDDNLPSLAVARKTGFVCQQEYTVFKMNLLA